MNIQPSLAVASMYYKALPNKYVSHPKRLILFSGVPGSGKSTIALAIEKRFSAIRISNDEIRNEIKKLNPMLNSEIREGMKLETVTELLKLLSNVPNGLIVNDASCDRGYDYYEEWSLSNKYRIVVIRLDIPRDIVEKRIRERGSVGNLGVTGSLANIDNWWQQWENFGETHKAALTITKDTPIEEVLKVVKEALR
jgi:tRNA uridine 5-carbamoylmethylation protein Kti12